MKQETIGPPPIINIAFEAGLVVEFGWFVGLSPLMRFLPKGNGEPVLVLPAFMTDDKFTKPLRRVLKRLNYNEYGWELGRNSAYSEFIELKIIERLKALHEEHDQKVSIIGWSLGGIYAREIAKKHPDLVKSVLTLASPIQDAISSSHISKFYEAMNGPIPDEHRDRLTNISDAPGVPTTAIFTKLDGIVNWKATVQPGSTTDELSENIGIPATHVGMVWNPLALYVIADRLSQPDNSQPHKKWKKFNPRGIPRLFFSKHCS